MTLIKRFIFHVCIAIFTSATILVLHYSVHAVESLRPDGRTLLARYSSIKTALEGNQYGIPLYLESKEESGSMHVDLYGVLNYPFDRISEELQSPGSWRDINFLHINVKACTFFRDVSGQWFLTLYSGRKYYQAPEDAHKLIFNFRIAAVQKDYLDIKLTAEKGPLFTTDHQIRFEAAPLEMGKTFIHFRYNYSYGVLARAAIKTYYQTIGRDKKGFSVIASGKNGDPVYVGGVKGSEERNAVRYYLAIQTYMDTLNIPEGQRFEKQISHWYDLTERFPLQLYEIDKMEYLSNKRREHANQLALQKEADK